MNCSPQGFRSDNTSSKTIASFFGNVSGQSIGVSFLGNIL